MHKINLQLFAEGETEVNELENHDQEQQQEIDQDEQQDQEEVSDQKEEHVPLATLLEEKKRRKELEKRIREIEEKSLDNEILTTKHTTKQRWLDKGFNEETADIMAEEIATLKAEIVKQKSLGRQEDYLDEELKDIAHDSFYSDAPAYKKEISAKLNEFKSKGIELSTEEAYHLVRGKARLREYKEDIEQKNALKRRVEGTPTPKVPNASASSPKNPYPLDETDKKALEGLQRLQPEKKWTAEKYWKIKNR